MPVRARQIECFHLAFLGVLAVRLDPARYVLKGGANLRYFFDSVRYSEDIDIDVTPDLNRNLEEKVDAILSGGPLPTVLRSCDVQVVGYTKPKQTATTRRWKVSIGGPGQEDPTRSKIEFSNRNGELGCVVESVPDRIVAPYGIRPPMVQHYRAEAAVDQKVRALAGRSETQARDVFDLELLLRKSARPSEALEPEVRAGAAERAMELPEQSFVDQVLPFLEPEVVELFGGDSWERMRSFVAEALREDR